MRLKTTPRQRQPNYFNPSSNGSEHLRSTDIARDMSVKFMDSHKHSYVVEGLKQELGETIREVSRSSSRYNPMQHVVDKYDKKIYCHVNTEGLTTRTSGAVNLSTKKNSAIGERNSVVDGSSSSDCTGSNDEFTGTVLYQIMTDPTFVENIKNDKEVKKLTCKFCKKKFINYNELLNHLDSRLDELDRITCCACRKTFGQKRYLRYHQRCHVVNDKFTCEICMKTYSRMDNLTRHRTYHTNPNKYSCEICEKTFTRRDLMTKHSKSHERKKNNCDTCEKVFVNLAKLKAHRLICTQRTKTIESTLTED